MMRAATAILLGLMLAGKIDAGGTWLIATFALALGSFVFSRSRGSR